MNHRFAYNLRSIWHRDAEKGPSQQQQKASSVGKAHWSYGLHVFPWYYFPTLVIEIERMV